MNGKPDNYHHHSVANYYRDQATTSEETFHGCLPGGAAITIYPAEAAAGVAVSAAQAAVDALADEDANDTPQCGEYGAACCGPPLDDTWER